MASADTYNWDTVNACRFTDVNTAIVAGNSSPASFAYTDVESGVTQGVVNGNFGAWQLVEGGDGKNVHMSIKVTDGQCVLYNDGQPQDPPYTYAGTAIIEVNLTYIPQPDGENGTPNNLQVSTTQTDPEDPVVAVLSFDFSESTTLLSYLQGYVKDCLAAWLTENLELFNNVFAVVNLNMRADTGSFQWLKPTYLGYAVTDNGSLDTSVFGVLAMTEGRTNPNLAHQISPNAIPDGANVGFLIAPDRFLEKVLLPGVYLMFKDAGPSDFEVTNSQVSNVYALNFQDLELENGTVKPASIGANNFTITLQGTQLILNFTDIMIDYEWGVTVHVDYKETTEAALDGSNQFQLNTVSYPITNTTIVISEGRQWVDFGAEFFLSVAGVIVGAVIGAAVEAALATEEAVEGATEVLSESLEEGVLESETEALMPAVDGTGYETFNDPEMIQTEADDSSVEMNAANEGNSSATQKAKGFLARNKVKILGSIVGGIAGVTVGDIPKILENIALDNTQDIPTLDTFAEESIDSVTWPYITGYQLTSAQFNESFQMGLTFTVAD